VQSALERPAAARAAFLADACGGDEDLRREAEALLERESRAGDFLGADVGALAAAAITYSPGGTPSSRDAVLAIGDKLGPYEIRARLGAGGMGEVYRAFDHSLGREVAIKLLPSIFSSDPERLARFEREARLLASLAHPHIGAIYGLQQSGDLRGIVLELIEGETLEERLRRGALPIEHALSTAVQIADALDHAHRRGVTHRDLKPANIMMTRAGARLLDFGLAKWSGNATGFVNAAAATTLRPEGVESLTLEGTILGTPQYMAPEQLEGRTVDARADVFAFGAVLYEMIAAKRAFDGGSTAAVMAAVLNTEPTFTELPPVPPSVERVIRKCLAKDPDDRWQTTRDLSDELRWIADPRTHQVPPATGAVPAPRRLRPGSVAVAALVALAMIVAGWAAWDFRSSRDISSGPVVRFSLPLQAPVAEFAISDDGTAIAYTQFVDGIAKLFIRHLDQLEASIVPGVERVNSPFFSPDGKWVAFFATGRLFKVNVDKFAAPILVSNLGPGVLAGAQWLADGTIIFSRTRHGLQRVPASGGQASNLTELNQTPPETDHHNPVMLPGGEAVLFTVHDHEGGFHVAVENLSTKVRKVVVGSAFDAKYLPSGHLAFARDRTILAAPFDLASLSITGPEVTVVDAVSVVADNGKGDYQLSPTGTLVYVPVTPTDGRTLTWVDRSGAETPLALPPRRYSSASISPDGRRIAVSIEEGSERDIYVHDLSTNGEVRFTRSGDSHIPIWSRDGKYLTYSTRSRTNPLGRTLMREPVDQASAAQELASGGTGLAAGAWTLRDERLLFTDSSTLPDGTRLLAVAPERPGRVERIADGPQEERQPSVSPDGRWLAFTSNETRRVEIYVTSLVSASTPRQISTEGGVLPKWSADGQEISFRSRRSMMAVAIDPANGAAVSKPRKLFEGHYVVGFDTMGMASDRSPDGRFLMIKPGPGEQTPQPLRVVVNWVAEIRNRVAAVKQ